MSNYHPILFSTPMVQAILEGRKTQTRRTVKLKGHDLDSYFADEEITLDRMQEGYKEGTRPVFTVNDDCDRDFSVKCPYGKVGDILWVRESWNHCVRVNSVTYNKVGSQFNYKADYKEIIKGHDKFKPSIHMPKEACRLFLKITDIKVERLQDISEEDAKAEGVQSAECSPESKTTCVSSFCKNEGCDGAGTYYRYPVDFDGEPCYSAAESFETLWQSINGEESWSVNPFV